MATDGCRRRSSAGPVIYRADRVGQGGRSFVMLKLRTMRLGLEGQGAITSATDPRIFPVGRWIRRLKLDELPQLVNVVQGDMALVGPRPEATEVVRDAYEPWMLETLTVPPGITGPGSLRYIRQERELPDSPVEAAQVYVTELLPQKLARELVYVRNRCFRYECQLILRTILSVVGAEGLMARSIEREALKAQEILSLANSERGR